MKILYVVPNPQRIGGLSTSINRITNFLKNKGLDIIVFCPDFEAQNNSSKSEMMMMKELLTGTMMQVHTQRVIEKAESVIPDILVGYYGSSAAYCATAAGKFLDIPVVACFRGNDINRDFFSSFHSHKLSFVAQNATAITTVSTEMSKKLKAWLGVPSCFISNSVDKSIFYNSKKDVASFKRSLNLSEAPIIGLFGVFKPSRGIEILQYLENDLNDKQVLIFGHVRASVQKQIPSHIKIVPYITDKDVLRVAYSACDVVLQPSNFDGMPNVVLEAMACERVVIASNTGGLKDLIQHRQNGFLCRTQEEWKEALELAIQNKASNIGVEARNSIPVIEQEANEFLNLFTEISKKTHN